MADWFNYTEDSEVLHLELKGSWRIGNLASIQKSLQKERLPRGLKSCSIDGAALQDIDTAGAVSVLRALGKLGLGADDVQLTNMSTEKRSIVELALNTVDEPKALRPRRSGALEVLGKNTYELLSATKSVLGFVGETSSEFFRAFLVPKTIRLKELTVQLEAVGLNAVPIVCLVTFLIGVVVAYLTGEQIAKYGANIFIVDGVAIAMSRELSPILVAIIVAGRSGSAYTAQLGTMKLNEEIDAMETLGLSTMRVLVLPRMLALMIAMPMLVFIGDIAGILGGMFVADFSLGVTGSTFIERLRVVLPLKHVMVGMIKAPVFAFFVAVIGCRMGLEVENNARSVGENTTGTVVRSIVAVVLLNAAFAIVFNELGI